MRADAQVSKPDDQISRQGEQNSKPYNQISQPDTQSSRPDNQISKPTCDCFLRFSRCNGSTQQNDVCTPYFPALGGPTTPPRSVVRVACFLKSKEQCALLARSLQYETALLAVGSMHLSVPYRRRVAFAQSTWLVQGFKVEGFESGEAT